MSEQSSERRARILAATLRLVGRDGAASLRTRKIACAAGVNLSAVHHCFDSKDALLLAALEEATTRMVAALPAPAGAAPALLAAMDETCASLGALVDSEPRVPLVRCELLLYLRRHPVHGRGARNQHVRYLAALADRYGGTADGDEHPQACHAFAELVASMVDGLALHSASLDAGDAPGSLPAVRSARVAAFHGSETRHDRHGTPYGPHCVTQATPPKRRIPAL
jgi:AcrR family transcriptional regulator